MLTFTSAFEPDSTLFGPAGYPAERLLYFDIETTGFSADVSSLYLIGCLYYRRKTWHTLQWFADDYCSEKSLLTSFFSFVEDFDVLIHYNGTGFDLPYLKRKCCQHGLPFSFDGIRSLDIYKELSPYKKLLPLPNLKQKTIEATLQIPREDCFDGGQLISVYVDYIHRKLKRQAGCDQRLALLLLHNREDLQGLFSISALLLPPELTLFQAADDSSGRLVYHLALPYHLADPLTIKKGPLCLTIEGSKVRAVLTPFTGELKYFYPDYKNYYYLPMEDRAIHKSVAEYVEKDYRQKARAANCYTRKTGSFLPFPAILPVPTGSHLFRQSYKGKELWLESSTAVFQEPSFVLAYLKAVLLT